MAQVVNIRRDVDDKFYRYRMPVLLTKIEGKGNGIKTVIPNMSDVAKALSRPPTYPTKFFGCELGAQTSFDEKADRYIVNGAHDATRLRELLDAFIDKFVLCGSCKNPETDLILTKTDDIIRDCKACGQQSMVDMRHKLTTFILKNPPKSKKSKKGKGDTNGGAHAVAPNGPGGGEEQEGNDTDDELTKRLKAEAAELATPDPNAKAVDNDWSADTSPEAIRARQQTLEGKVKSMTLGDDSEEDDADSPYSQLANWAEENGETATAVDVYKKAQELGIEKKHKTVQILVESLLSEDVLKEIPKFAPAFVKLVTTEKHQKALLGGVERLVGIEHPNLISVVPKILMAFYQEDVLPEEIVKHWATHVSRKYVDRDTSKKVRRAAEPFLKWLDEAEDEDEDDDDE